MFYFFYNYFIKKICINENKIILLFLSLNFITIVIKHYFCIGNYYLLNLTYKILVNFNISFNYNNKIFFYNINE
jgi:hypothetical protein